MVVPALCLHANPPRIASAAVFTWCWALQRAYVQLSINACIHGGSHLHYKFNRKRKLRVKEGRSRKLKRKHACDRRLLPNLPSWTDVLKASSDRVTTHYFKFRELKLKTSGNTISHIVLHSNIIISQHVFSFHFCPFLQRRLHYRFRPVRPGCRGHTFSRYLDVATVVPPCSIHRESLTSLIGSMEIKPS
jgi:hypothetical protein